MAHQAPSRGVLDGQPSTISVVERQQSVYFLASRREHLCLYAGIKNDLKRAKDGEGYTPNGVGNAYSHNFLNQVLIYSCDVQRAAILVMLSNLQDILINISEMLSSCMSLSNPICCRNLGTRYEADPFCKYIEEYNPSWR